MIIYKLRSSQFTICTMMLLFTFMCQGQGLKIHNSKSETIISKSQPLEVGVGLDDCCSSLIFNGRFVSESKDSIKFNFTTSELKQKLEDSSNNFNKNYLNNSSYKTIAKNNIYYINNYKSEKSKKRRGRIRDLGAIVMLAGLGTGISALILANEDRKTLLLASGIQVVTGLAIGVSAVKKEKYFKEKKDLWLFSGL